MAWLILIVAGLFEVAWAYFLKTSKGFTQLGPSLAFLATMGVSMAGLGWSLNHLPMGTAYAVWTGVGAVGTALLGIWLFGEPATALRLGSIGLILLGIAGLRYAAGAG
ncbi:DMT family transporter [Paludisphaera mucosa]|uniref:Guanidinium exporter n=1 Tax=Paludisphaera mucosa TaxID=3030827 RepID=A0ABT6FJA6_9BACT|nr:multidrug efflux SMR transporter [Paludisphaera mucosa]MDG3007438.1 multidrug efflux SMR transporter [Paludisphaera mucosa]